MDKCYEAICQGRELTMWDTIQEYLYFFWFPAALIVIGISIIIWLARK